MLKKLLSLPGVALLFSQITYGITVMLPRGNYNDVNIKRTQIEGNSDKVLSTISFINQYLWYAIGLICFIFLIFNGVRLVMARGDKEDMKKAMKGLLGSAIGIVICFISYSFVRVIVNLFV
jgi:hypothetical protein